MSQLPPSLLQSIMANALSAPPLPSSAGAMWVYVIKRFQAFSTNLDLTPAQLSEGRKKFEGVVSCLNTAYFGTASTTDNAFFIGSWAKDTHIRPPRDVDLYFILPLSVYQRYEAYGGWINKQSALLQEVKGKLLASFPRSDIKGDGPVVMAAFDSYNVEIVPAFRYDDKEVSYYVCDTKNGGSYKKTMPWHEVAEIKGADSRNNSNVRPLIRMLKCWQAYCSVPIKSFYLELLAVEFLDQWAYRLQSYYFYDWMCRDFFAWMTGKANSFLNAPGTFELLWLGDDWKSRAESAYGRAAKACDFERVNDMANAGTEWQKVFGLNIPKYV